MMRGQSTRDNKPHRVNHAKVGKNLPSLISNHIGTIYCSCADCLNRISHRKLLRAVHICKMLAYCISKGAHERMNKCWNVHTHISILLLHDETGLGVHLNITLGSSEQLWVSSQVTEGDIAGNGSKARQGEVNESDCHATGGCLYGMTPA